MGIESSCFRLSRARVRWIAWKRKTMVKIIFLKNSTYRFEFTNFVALKELQYAYSK